MLAVLALPLLAALVVALGEHWYPTGDFAYIELHLRAIPFDPPLVGVAGRFGSIFDQGSHAGPAMAYALWPIYAAFGRSAQSLLLATVFHHLVAFGATVVVLRRAGGAGLAVIAGVVIAWMARASGADFFVSPWNPWLASTAYLVFLAAVFAAASGRWRAIPVAVAVGTYCAQTHVSYMVLVHGMLALLAGWSWVLARSSWSGTTWADLRRAVKWSAGVLAVAWALPLYDQLFRSGNLSSLVRYFATTDEPAAGPRTAARALATQWNAAGPWLTGGEPDVVALTPSLTGFVVFVGFVGVGTAVAVRRRDRPALTLLGVAGAAALLGAFSATRILGELFEYVMRWSWPIAAFLTIAAGWSIWRAAAAAALGADPSARRRKFAVLGVAAAAVPALALTVAAPDVEVANPVESRLTRGLTDGLAVKLDPDGPYLIRWHDPAGLGAPGAGLMLELEREGITVGSDAWTRFAVMPHRVLPEDEALAVLWVVTGDASIDRFVERGDTEPLVRFDPRTPEQRDRSDELRAAILAGLEELGRADLVDAIDAQYGNAVLIAAGPTLPPGLNAQIQEYTDLRLPGAVFQVAPGSPPFP